MLYFFLQILSSPSENLRGDRIKYALFKIKYIAAMQLR